MLSYAIVPWGSTCKSNLKKLQTKQNHIVRIIFFATLHGKDKESTLPLLNLLDILSIDEILLDYMHVLKFTHN